MLFFSVSFTLCNIVHICIDVQITDIISRHLLTPVPQWLPVFRDGSLQTGEHSLPVMMEKPPSNYPYITADIHLPGTKWVDNHKGLFTVSVEAVSSVHAQVIMPPLTLLFPSVYFCLPPPLYILYCKIKEILIITKRERTASRA